MRIRDRRQDPSRAQRTRPTRHIEPGACATSDRRPRPSSPRSQSATATAGAADGRASLPVPAFITDGDESFQLMSSPRPGRGRRDAVPHRPRRPSGKADGRRGPADPGDGANRRRALGAAVPALAATTRRAADPRRASCAPGPVRAVGRRALRLRPFPYPFPRGTGGPGASAPERMRGATRPPRRAAWRCRRSRSPRPPHRR